MRILKRALRAPLYVLRVAALVAAIFFLHQWLVSPFQDFTIQRHSGWFLPSIGIQFIGAYLLVQQGQGKNNVWKVVYALVAVGTMFINQVATFHWWIAALLILVYPLRGTSKLLAVAGAGFVFHVLAGLFGGEPFSIEVLLVAASMAVFAATHLYLSLSHKGGEHGKEDDHKEGDGDSHTTPSAPKKEKKGRSPGMPKGSPW